MDMEQIVKIEVSEEDIVAIVASHVRGRLSEDGLYFEHISVDASNIGGSVSVTATKKEEF